MIGHPKYDYDDIVRFKMRMNDKDLTLEGAVGQVDVYGTFFDDSDVSYDIMVKDFQQSGKSIYFQHIREDSIIKKVTDEVKN